MEASKVRPEDENYPPIVSADELRDLGILQEINRLFLHPLGLALAVATTGGTLEGEEIPKNSLMVLDSREDPEGWIFEFDADDFVAKFEKFAQFREGRHRSRKKALGYIIQPLPESERGGD